MSYIKFDKSQLVNLEYSLERELLRSNRAGSFACTTIISCNTRKYHGLLIVPQPAVDDGIHVLLSNLDETVIQRNAEFNLAIHKFKGEIYSPKGHKYVRDFEADPIPKITYGVGGVILTKERLFASRDDRILIRYTLVDAHSPTKLRFRPFLAFRNIHTVTRANMDADRKYQPIENGIKLRMYKGYSYLHMQFSKEVEYTHVPDWWYNFEYYREKRRGYDCYEDLYTPGFFEVPIRKGESIIFSAGLEPIKGAALKRMFTIEMNKRIPRDTFTNCLINAAQQFIVKRGRRTEIIAGYPWFGRWGRDTFIALPGLTLLQNDTATFWDIIDTMISDMKGPFFPDVGTGEGLKYNSVDTSLWFFWTLQQYVLVTGDVKGVWTKYNKRMKTILERYRNGTMFNIRMDKDGLLYAGEPGKALTWMDAYVEGKPVTPRIGKTVEVNALWYNAIMLTYELASIMGDKSYISKWKAVKEMIPESFIHTFWDQKRGYLADYVNGEEKDWSVRPNMIFAASLSYAPIDQEKRKKVLDVVKNELLTPRGIRTLSPKNPDYKGIYFGDQTARDLAYHNGTAFPWLLGHFLEGYLKLHGKSGLRFAREVFSGFEDVVDEHGIGTVSECYDGDPPHYAGGALSQAWSVAELLRIDKMIRDMEEERKNEE